MKVKNVSSWNKRSVKMHDKSSNETHMLLVTVMKKLFLLFKKIALSIQKRVRALQLTTTSDFGGGVGGGSV